MSGIRKISSQFSSLRIRSPFNSDCRAPMLLCEYALHNMLEKSCQQGFIKGCFLVRKHAIQMGGLRLNFPRTQTLQTLLLTSNYSNPFKLSPLPDQFEKLQQTCHSQRREGQERVLPHESKIRGAGTFKVGRKTKEIDGISNYLPLFSPLRIYVATYFLLPHMVLGPSHFI